MTKLSHILAATDFSEPSLIAVDRATQLANQHQASLTVFHGFNAWQLETFPRGFGGLLSEARASVKNETQNRLQMIAAKQKAQGTVEVNAIMVEGNSQEALSEALSKSKADLLVLGAHGEGYWHELFLGSYISSLLAHSTVPVLVAKQAPTLEYKNILIPVDFSDVGETLIHLAQTIAPSARKTLLHIPSAPLEGMMRLKNAKPEEIMQYKQLCIDEAQTKLNKLLASIGDPSFTGKLVGQNYAPSEIISYQMENKCDLVLIGKHGAGYVSDLLIGSITKLVISNVTCDTLVSVDTPKIKK